MRIRVADVVDMLADGVTAQEILAEFFDLEAEGVRVCLHFAAKRADIARLVA